MSDERLKLLEILALKAFYVWRSYRITGGEMKPGEQLQISVNYEQWIELIRATEALDAYDKEHGNG